MSEPSPIEFARMIKSQSCGQGLSNVAFFVGSGFSKAWDRRSPGSSELFTIDVAKLDVARRLPRLMAYLESHGYEAAPLITPAMLKDLIYQLNMQLKYPEIRSRYVDDQNLQLVHNEIKALIQLNFERALPLDYWDEDLGKLPLPDRPSMGQRAILDFFRLMDSLEDCSARWPKGVRHHFITTNYDFIIETILDGILPPQQSYHRHSYRGFTPVSVSGRTDIPGVQRHWLVDQLLKINGGFEILRDEVGKYSLEYRQRDLDGVAAHAPIIMPPSREQNYDDPYFRALFTKAVRLLQESQILVIVGYSFTVEDSLLRFLLRQFAETAADARNKVIFYVGRTKGKSQKDKITAVFPWFQQSGPERIFTYSGGFTNWAKAVLSAM